MTKSAHVVLIASLLCLSAGCIRQIRPSLGGDRNVDTGVPVTLGSEHPDAPELTYDFGDGTPPKTGKLVRHAYSQAGRYRVFALDEGKPLEAVIFTAVPRRVTRALPPTTNGAIFFRQIEGNLDVAIDFIEKLLGSEAAQNFIESSPLIEMGMELTASHTLKDRGIDGEEGLGVFTINEFPGTVALIGVIDGEKALAALVQVITRGGSPAYSGNDGTTRVRLRDGREAALLIDRGYLYLIVPDAPAPDPRFADAPPDELARDTGLNKTDFTPVLNALKSGHALGFEGTGALNGLEDKVQPGNAYLYMSVDKAAKTTEQGAFASFQMKPERLDVDGFYRSKRPWGVRQTSALPLLQKVPKGALAAITLSVPPNELANFFFGAPGSEARTKATAKAQRGGIPFEELLAALTGDLFASIYFDAKAAMTAMAKSPNPTPQFKGSLVAEAGLNDGAAFEKFLEVFLKDPSLRLQRVKEAGFVRYSGVVEGQPVDVALTANKMQVSGGEPVSARGTEDLGARLRQEFGADAFGPGHLSVAIFTSQLRAELAQVKEIAGVPEGKVEMFKAFAEAMLSQLPPVDVLFVDVSSTEGGARVKGRILLRQRTTP